MQYQLRCLGPPVVLNRDGMPVPLSQGKPLALLIYVACSHGPVPRDDLAELLWPDADRQKGRHSVRQALWVLRNAFAEEVFDTEDPLSLRSGVIETDIRKFGEALSEGRVTDARALWRGPVLEQFGLAGVRRWNHWIEELRADLETRFSRALLYHARAAVESGDADAALSALDQAIEVAPSSEEIHLARISLLLDLLRLDAGREAISDAHRLLYRARVGLDHARELLRQDGKLL